LVSVAQLSDCTIEYNKGYPIRIIQPGTTDKRVHTSIDSTTAESTAVPSQIPKDRDADIPKQWGKIVMSNTFDGVFFIIR